jgi:hypothetical protein
MKSILSGVSAFSRLSSSTCFKVFITLLRPYSIAYICIYSLMRIHSNSKVAINPR